MGRPLHGTAVVIAMGTKKKADDSAYWAADPDADKAASSALTDCRHSARDCRLTYATWDSGYSWAAVASNQDDAVYLVINANTRDEAINGAIRGCEENAAAKGKCEAAADLVTSNRAWFAFSRSASGTRLGVSEVSETEATQRALEFCRKGSKGAACQIAEVQMNRGLMLAPDSFTALKARITRGNAQRSAPANKPVPEKVAAAPVPNGNAECRPKGATLRCTSQCSNGNCVVTYENGCKIRVQVQPRFDSFNNRWDYPAPGC